MKIFLEDGSQYNISIKKSLSGQVYLISTPRFITGFEMQYNTTIPSEIKRAIELFWGYAQDTKDIIDQYGTNKTYEYRKNRLVADTIIKYDNELYTKLLNWFVENIYEITDFCFSRGLAKEKSEWANLVWYKNELGENKIDDLFSIDELCKKVQSIAKESINYGTSGRRYNNSIAFWICTMA